MLSLAISVIIRSPVIILSQIKVAIVVDAIALAAIYLVPTTLSVSLRIGGVVTTFWYAITLVMIPMSAICLPICLLVSLAIVHGLSISHVLGDYQVSMGLQASPAVVPCLGGLHLRRS